MSSTTVMRQAAADRRSDDDPRHRYSFRVCRSFADERELIDAVRAMPYRRQGEYIRKLVVQAYQWRTQELDLPRTRFTRPVPDGADESMRLYFSLHDGVALEEALSRTLEGIPRDRRREFMRVLALEGWQIEQLDVPRPVQARPPGQSLGHLVQNTQTAPSERAKVEVTTIEEPTSSSPNDGVEVVRGEPMVIRSDRKNRDASALAGLFGGFFHGTPPASSPEP